MRRFARVLKYPDAIIPERKTARSAGYDLTVAEDTVCHPGQTVLVPTGLKAYMENDEVLLLYIRSSTAIKRNFLLVNSVGVIDADYVDNPDNEGHIMVALMNTDDLTQVIKKGERIAQGVFVKFLTVDGDNATGERLGGVGSTGSK